MSSKEQTKKWYKENAQRYVDHVRNPKNSIYHAYYEKPAMYSLVPDLSHKQVLSLGCGSGEDSFYLKTRGASKSTGIDLSSELLDFAKVAYKECVFLEMDMEELLFENESFDFVYSSLAIHYLEDWSKVFKEVFRVLKPNSYFLFSCNHPASGAMEVTFESDQTISKLEIRSNNLKKESVVIGNYLDRHLLKDVLGKNSVDNWHKSLTEIFSEATAAGFVVETLLEPRPVLEMKKISPAHYNVVNTIPWFVIFRLIKPFR